MATATRILEIAKKEIGAKESPPEAANRNTAPRLDTPFMTAPSKCKGEEQWAA